MANSVKHTILTKKINGVLYDLYPKTDASIVVHNDTTVAAELESIASTLHDLANGDTSIDARIEAAKTALYNQIMGITEEDGATVAEAFDTLKEVANYLTEHGSVVQGFTDSINALETAVGNSESGLVKKVADLEQAVANLGGNVEGLHTPQVYTYSGDTTDIDTAVKDLENMGTVFGQGDVVIITDTNEIKSSYQYNQGAWVALNGKVSADNVVLKHDITLAGNYTSIGNVNKGSNSAVSTLYATGKTLTAVLQDIFTQELQPTKTEPSVSLTMSQAGDHEVGTSVKPQYRTKLNAGSYTYGPETGITASAWEVTNTDGGSKDTASGSFDAITVGDNTNYTITAKATYGDGTSANTNLGNIAIPIVKISAGNKSKTSGAIKGYRKSFYGSLINAKDALASSDIRALAGSGKSSVKSFSVTVVEGAKEVIIAVPTGLTLKSVEDTGAFGTDIVASFVKETVNVEGANSYTAKEYNVYVYKPATALGANTYKVTIQ